jgi:hypothetical protein
MRRLRALGVGVVVLVGLIGAVPTVSAGGPPEDRVVHIGPDVVEVQCDGASITRTETGWVGLPGKVGNPTHYHLAWVYSNADGAAWRYIDTGLIRTFERDGDPYVSLSGRSVNVGPDETGWVGHWEMNLSTGEVWRAGLGVGDVDQRACSVLAPSS